MDVDFYIANHDMIAHKEIATLVRKRKDIDLIILDEASFFRNSRNISYKFFAWATENKKRIWMLSWHAVSQCTDRCAGRLRDSSVRSGCPSSSARSSA